MNPERKVKGDESPDESASPVATGEEQKARLFLERLLSTSATAKVRVSLYPESHPLVQELLKKLHELIAKALKDRTELVLEFQPGRIVVDSKSVIGGKENIARFSQDMYRRRVARLVLDNSLDLPSLFQFLKFITTDVEILHRQARAMDSFFPSFRGIHLEEVDYERLTKIRGTEALTREPDERDRSILELLYGKTGAIAPRGVAITKYIPLSDSLIKALDEISPIEKEPELLEPDLPPDRQVSILFRNIVAAISTINTPAIDVHRKELAEHFYHLDPQMRSEMLLEELMEKGEKGNLFALCAYLNREQTEEILTPLRRQAQISDSRQLADQLEKLTSAILEHVRSAPEKKRQITPPASEITGEAFLTSLKEAFAPTFVTAHYERLLKRIFGESQDIVAIERCIDSLAKDVGEQLSHKEWAEAKVLIRKILSTLNVKRYPNVGSAKAIIKLLKKRVIDALEPILLFAVGDDDSDSIASAAGLLTMFQLTPEEIFLDSLPHVEERHIRKKIISYVTRTGHLPQTSLLRMLNAGEWFVVRNAVTLIREIADREFVELLEKPLTHPHPQVRKEVLLALARIKGKKALNLIFRLYSNSTQPPELRALALECMGGFDDPRIRDLCTAILQDERNPSQDLDVRVAGIRQLGRFKDSGTVKNLLKFIKKPRLLHRGTWVELKRATAYALEQIDTIEARGALLQAEKYLPGR